MILFNFPDILMRVTATTFLELWKRRQAVLVWEWDLQNADYDEEPRPEFEASVKTYRINPVTKEKEPYLPASSKALRCLATSSLVFFMVIIYHIFFCVFLSRCRGIAVASTVITVVIYALDLRGTWRSFGNDRVSHLAGRRLLRWRR